MRSEIPLPKRKRFSSSLDAWFRTFDCVKSDTACRRVTSPDSMASSIAKKESLSQDCTARNMRTTRRVGFQPLAESAELRLTAPFRQGSQDGGNAAFLNS